VKKRKYSSASTNQVSVADCMRIHQAIHDPKATKVKLSSGEELPVGVSSNKCRSVKILGVTFMEQNLKKPSMYTKRAKQGHKITWILQNPRWGMLCDDRVEISCSLIDHTVRPEQDDNADDDDDDVEKKKKKSTKGKAPGGSKKKRTAGAATDNAEDEEEGADSLKRKPSLDDGSAAGKKGKKGEAESSETSSTHKLQLHVEFPSHWEPPFTGPREVALVTGKEFDELVAMFRKTMEPKFEIISIKRLQNPALWPHYFLKRQAVQDLNQGKPEKLTGMSTKLLDPESNEFLFYHGCSASVVDKIQQGGFDERLSSLKGLFGSGIYLADNATKSLQYTHAATCAQVGAVYGASACTCRNKTGVVRSMFLVRGVLGTPWVRYVATDQENPMRRPPARPSGLLYDSVMGEAKKNDTQARLQYREFILYDRQQCYPEYLLEFTLL